MKERIFSKRVTFVTLIFMLQAALCLVTFEWITRGSLLSVFRWIFSHPIYGLYNLVVMLLLLGFFTVIFWDLRWGYLTVQVLAGIFGARSL